MIPAEPDPACTGVGNRDKPMYSTSKQTCMPVVLTIAGSDSGAGAGLQADLKTFAALGVYGTSVVTAVTAQNTRGVQAAVALSPDIVLAQLEAVFSDFAIKAVKIGMLHNEQLVTVVADYLARQVTAPVILDPVITATSGHALLSESAIEVLKQKLIPQVELVTPNLPEAALLTAQTAPATPEQMRQLLRPLLALGSRGVLLKGGHLGGDRAIDWLAYKSVVKQYAQPRIATANTHGTGCTLSAAITAGLARGLSMEEAVQTAKKFLTAALSAADKLGVGSGHGPVHHFFAQTGGLPETLIKK